MAPNNRQHQTQRFQRLADSLPGGGMPLHDDPLFRSEICTFFQDFIGHGDLAQIVQISAAAQGHDGLLVEPEVTSEIAGVVCQTLAVAFGIRIAAFNAQSESAQY